MKDKWITLPRQMTDEMFNAFSKALPPMPNQYAVITKAWYLAVHAAPQSARSEEGRGE